MSNKGSFYAKVFSCYIALCTCRTKRKLVLVTLIMNDQNLDLPEVNCSYYEVQEYRDTVNKLNDLVVFHHNVRSFNRNFDQLSLLLDSVKQKVGVIVLSETWFTERLCTEIDGYVGHHVCRRDRVGGGVSVYVRCGLTCTLLTQVTCINEHYEICAVEVSPQNTDRTQNFIVLGVYRPPDASLPTFIDKIEGIISAIPNKPLMIAGNVNVDLLMDGHNLEFFNCLLSYNFYPLINVATRVTEISSKCLDQI